MKNQLFLFMFSLFSLSVFSQQKGEEFINKNFIFSQNICGNDVKIIIENKYLDTIKCRIDSVFKTNNISIFYLKSYDENNKLIAEATLHIHLNISELPKNPDENLFLTSLFKNKFSLENRILYNHKGNIVESIITCCDFYLYKMNNWDYFGTTEFGSVTTFKSDKLKRMPSK